MLGLPGEPASPHDQRTTLGTPACGAPPPWRWEPWLSRPRDGPGSALCTALCPVWAAWRGRPLRGGRGQGPPTSGSWSPRPPPQLCFPSRAPCGPDTAGPKDWEPASRSGSATHSSRGLRPCERRPGRAASQCHAGQPWRPGALVLGCPVSEAEPTASPQDAVGHSRHRRVRTPRPERPRGRSPRPPGAVAAPTESPRGDSQPSQARVCASGRAEWKAWDPAVPSTRGSPWGRQRSAHRVPSRSRG